MSGVRSGARSVLKWFSPLYVVLLIVQVFLAGEGVFRLKTVYDSDTCKKAVCGGSTVLDPHRFLGFVLTEPLALLFLIRGTTRLVSGQPHPDRDDRGADPDVPPVGVGWHWQVGWWPSRPQRDRRLGVYGWLTYSLRREQPAPAEGAPAAARAQGGAVSASP